MQIAVIGSGIAGLSAAWLLSQRYTVTLYEAGDYLGGHSHTVDVTLDGHTAPVDTGFLVFNRQTYPTLVDLFQHLGVATVPSEMTFSVRIDGEGVEWAGTSLATLFAQPRNLLRLPFWRMLGEVLRFNRLARVEAQRTPESSETLGAFLERHRFSREFRDWYLLPMAGAIWSCPTAQMLEYPLFSFARFCHNHGLLQVNDRPQWYTVDGGSRTYVQRLAEGIGEIRLGEPVQAVRRGPNHAEVISAAGTRRYHQVVLASHPDQSLALLQDPSAGERELLGSFEYQPNRAVLHTDPRLLPAERSAWSAWNYLAAAGRPEERPVSVSYLINKLQPLPFTTPVVVTLNPRQPIDPARVLGEYHYEHPVFDSGALDAQRRLASIQGPRNTWFCGAWTGFGFHEDGLRSGLTVARQLGCAPPWLAGSRAA